MRVVNTPAAVSAALASNGPVSGAGGDRSIRRAPARVIRRTLAPAAIADFDTVRALLNARQDTGRTFIEECGLLFRISELSTVVVPDLKKQLAAVDKAAQGTDAPALVAAMNRLADTLNPVTDDLMAALTTLRDFYADIGDSLKAHFSGDGLIAGRDQVLLKAAESKIRQANFKEDPDAFVREILAFRKWVQGEEYAYAYDEFVAAHPVETPEEQEQAEPAELPAGRTTVLKLRGVAPVGSTAGQRYSSERKMTGCHYHLSVSYKIIESKANLSAKPSVKQLEVQNFHVSFEPNAGGAKTYYWWKRTGAGKFAFDKVAGPPGNAAKRNAADALVASAAPELNCTV